jgi:hypothetical protein
MPAIVIDYFIRSMLSIILGIAILVSIIVVIINTFASIALIIILVALSFLLFKLILYHISCHWNDLLLLILRV